MSLFNVNEIKPPDLSAKTESSAISESLQEDTVLGNSEQKVHDIIGVIEPGHVCTFWSVGDWSLYQLVEKLLEQTGPGTELYLATWSISELSARKLLGWVEEGKVSKIVGVIDYRSKNRHPAAFHLAKNVFSKIKIAYCHAKVTALIGGGHNITINGSANWTENPRLESGVIINSKTTTDKVVGTICEVVEKGQYSIDD